MNPIVHNKLLNQFWDLLRVSVWGEADDVRMFADKHKQMFDAAPENAFWRERFHVEVD